MKEIREPATRKVFEGEACRVVVEREDSGVSVRVLMLSGDKNVSTPGQFAALSRDFAAVNERVQEFARELVREPVGAVKT